MIRGLDRTWCVQWARMAQGQADWTPPQEIRFSGANSENLFGKPECPGRVGWGWEGKPRFFGSRNCRDVKFLPRHGAPICRGSRARRT